MPSRVVVDSSDWIEVFSASASFRCSSGFCAKTARLRSFKPLLRKDRSCPVVVLKRDHQNAVLIGL